LSGATLSIQSSTCVLYCMFGNLELRRRTAPCSRSVPRSRAHPPPSRCFDNPRARLSSAPPPARLPPSPPTTIPSWSAPAGTLCAPQLRVSFPALSLYVCPTSPPPSTPHPPVTMAFVGTPLAARGGLQRRGAAAAATTVASPTRPTMAASPPSRSATLRSAAAAAVLALALSVGVPTAAHAVLPAPKLPPIDKNDKTRYVWGGGAGRLAGA